MSAMDLALTFWFLTSVFWGVGLAEVVFSRTPKPPEPRPLIAICVSICAISGVGTVMDSSGFVAEGFACGGEDFLKSLDIFGASCRSSFFAIAVVCVVGISFLVTGFCTEGAGLLSSSSSILVAM